MSEPLAVQCPACQATLKLKSRAAVGKRIACPKCKQPFVVELPDDVAADDREQFDSADPWEGQAMSEPEDELHSGLPPSTGRARPKPKPRPSASRGNWKTPVLLTGVAIAALALVGGAAYFVVPLLDGMISGGAIDTAWLPPESDVIVRARVAEAWKSPFVSSFNAPPGMGSAKDLLGLDPKEIRTLTIGGVGLLEAQGGKVGGPFGLVLGGNAPHAITVLRTVDSFDPRQMESKLQGVHTVKYKQESLVMMGGLQAAGRCFFFPDSSTVVMGAEADVKAAIDRGSKAAPRPDLDFLDRDQQLLVVLAPKNPAYFDSQGTNSPAGSGLAELEGALKGKVKAISLGVKFSDKVDWSVAANCNSAAAASEASAGIDKAIAEGKSQFNQFRGGAPPALSELVITLDSLLNSITVRAQKSVLEVRGQVPGSVKNLAGQLPQLMAGGFSAAMGGAGGLQGSGQAAPGGLGNPSLGDPQFSGGIGAGVGAAGAQPDPSAQNSSGTADVGARKNSLREIGLAMYSAASTINRFPDTAIYDSSGRALLSWRVALLPYLNEQELYNEFNRDEPWDSEQNKKLIARMPAVFARAGVAGGSTCCLAVQGPGAMFEGGRGRGLPEVTDGTASTILLVEVDASLAVPWTKPDDFTFDPEAPLNGLVGDDGDGIVVLMADSSAYFLKQPLDPARLAALITRSGGEKILPGTLR